MSNKTAQGLLVRKVQFEFPPDFQPHWRPDDPALSQLINGTSLLLPYMEPFIIDAIREASKHITDPDLQKEAKAWTGQESQHFMQHRRFNEVLIAKGYPQLREREKEIEQEYEQLKTRSLKFQVAYTAGFETMALALDRQLSRTASISFAVPILPLFPCGSGTSSKKSSIKIWRLMSTNMSMEPIGIASTGCSPR